MHEATLVGVQPHPTGCVLTITPPLPAALEARHGGRACQRRARDAWRNRASQILGAGDASKSFQRFELKRMPLTYRSAANETGADSELSVRVGDVEWAEKPTLFGSHARRARLHAQHRRTGQDLGRVRRRRARRAAAERREQRARAVTARAWAATATCGADKLTQLMTRPLGLEERQQPGRGAGRHRPRAGRPGAPHDAAGHAHAWAARCRCSTTKTSRWRSPASPKRRRRCCSCRPGRRSPSPSPARTALPLSHDQPGVEQPAAWR